MRSTDGRSRAELTPAPSLREWLGAGADGGPSVALCLAGVWLGHVLGVAINR